MFLNIVLDEAAEEFKDKSRKALGMVVIRGNSVVLIEAMDKIDDPHQRGGHR